MTRACYVRLRLPLFVSLAQTFLPVETAQAARDIQPWVNPELRAHTALFEKRVYRVAGNVHSAVGWGLANSIMIEGDDGIVIVDVGEDIDSAREVYKEFRKITDKPVKAVIYTHHHPDHINGVKAFVTEEQVQRGEVRIIAHSTLLENVVNQGNRVGPILGIRTVYTGGAFLGPADREGSNLGIGPNPNVGRATFIAPTLTYDDRTTLTIAGIEMELRHVPSEAPDETAVYLPRSNVLLSAEVIQGPTLPNIHTLRGTKFRDPVQWYKSIDVLREYQAEFMVPAHGLPVSGRDEVERVLRVTRDGIQYIHDQSIRGMNKGLVPDELAEQIALPPHLAAEKPYLQEFYGTVKHSVRQVYLGYLGWFSGDPVDLDPIPRVERSRRYVALMGGHDAVLREAQKAYEARDYQWAAELATHLVRLDREDMAARSLKADCFRMQGYASINSNWRNWYLTSAMELDGSLDLAMALQRLQAAIASPDLLAALPASSIVEGLSVWLKAEDTADTRLLLVFDMVDSGESYALEIRRSVAQFHPHPLGEAVARRADARLAVNKPQLLQLISGKLSLGEAVEQRQLRVSGDSAAAARFFGYFDKPQPINLTVR